MKIPDVIKEAARKMRNNPTILWSHIRRDISGFRFLRQKPIYVYIEDSGLERFIIPDFYCHQKKFVIELDGSIHSTDEVYLLDRKKEEILYQQGIIILRIENEEIMNNISNVMKIISRKLS